MKLKYFSTLFIVISITACKPKAKDIEPTSGDMNPDRFVMIGGSATAGFMDDALYFEGQQNSVAAILAKQFETVGSGAFYQPLVAASSVGVNFSDLSRTKLGYKTDCKNVTGLSPVRLALSGDVSIWNDNLYDVSKPFGNYGIPGFYMAYAFSPAYSSQNNFFKRMASSSTASVMGDAMASNPTFFAVYLGLEEVLSHAKTGAKNTSMLTASEFETVFVPILNQLTSQGAKGAVATLPDVTDMPYFTTIPYNGLTLDAESAETLNEIYNPIGIYFNVGVNPFVIEDPDAGAFGVRLMEEGEMILLNVPLDSVKCHKMGSVFPLRDEFVLTNTEISEIRNNTTLYNNLISSKAAEKGCAVVDLDALYSSLKTGIVYNGISISAKFVSGGAYSLDGINLNPRGNALLANQFIKAINTKFNSRIPLADPTIYRGVIFP